MNAASIPGYTYGSPTVTPSPLSDAEFDLLKRTVMLADEDLDHLRLAGAILDGQVEAILDVWYGFVGSHPHLVTYFSGPDGEPDPAYLAAVRKRFGQWIRDTCAANFDRQWLDYQYEVGLRHTRHKKNTTDSVRSATDVINLRYLVAFIVPLTLTIRPFLEGKGHAPEAVEKMFQAWLKALTLTTALWAQPYVPAEDF